MIHFKAVSWHLSEEIGANRLKSWSGLSVTRPRLELVSAERQPLHEVTEFGDVCFVLSRGSQRLRIWQQQWLGFANELSTSGAILVTSLCDGVRTSRTENLYLKDKQ